MTLTPDERRRVYEEEKEREKARKKNLLTSGLGVDGSFFGLLLLAGFIMTFGSSFFMLGLVFMAVGGALLAIKLIKL